METDSMYIRFGNHGRDGSGRIPELYYFTPLKRDGKVVGLILSVHSIAHSTVCEFFHSEQRGISGYAKERGLEIFSPKDAYEWGYGKVILTKPSDRSGWFDYQINFSEGLNTNQVSHTLHMVLTFINYFVEKETDAITDQLIIVPDLIWRGGLGGAGLSASLSPAVRQWTSSFGFRSSDQVQRVMKETYYSFLPKKNQKFYSSSSFQNRIDGDRFHLVVPGNCACFFVDGVSKGQDSNRCYKMEPHNIDGPNQQLTILTGLAEIWSLVRHSQ